MKTVVISDCHIGSARCQPAALICFLDHLECDRLIIAGDFWELWWDEPGRLRLLYPYLSDCLTDLAKKGTRLEYVLGNHDSGYVDDPIMPLDLLPVVKQAEIDLGAEGKVAVIHGHEFDQVFLKRYPWYRLSFSLDEWLRRKLGKGLPGLRRRSLSDFTDQSKYRAVLQRVHDTAAKAYHEKGYQALIMGHTHFPALQDYGGFLLVNAGDWMSSLTWAEVDGDQVTLRFYKPG
jgi:UDP-2,3-diacylglucosamine pyrophosphatase LpxH